MPAVIRIQPEEPLVDDDLHIQVIDLVSVHLVTLVARLEEEGLRFISWAHYTFEAHGCIDLTKHGSQGGTYTGVEPNGLIWSMQPEEGQRKGLRLLKRDVATPLVTSIKAYEGHFDASDLRYLSQRSPLVSTSINRWYLGRVIIRKEIKVNGLVGTFFIPRGPGPYSAVLDMFGTIGGTVEHRAALLASRGFATFALSYFNPRAETMLQADMEYYEKAVEWLLEQPNVNRIGVGVIGVSKGFEMALLTGVVSPKVKAVVGINGTYHVTLIENTYRDLTFPALEITHNDTLWKNENDLLVMKNMYDKEAESEKEKCAIPVEKSCAKFLLIFGGDDQCIRSLAAEYIPRRLALHGRPEDCHVVTYPGAGHLIEPPHSQFCEASYHASFDSILLWGGEARLHARAQEDHWRLLQDFLRKHLPQENTNRIESKM